MKKHHFAVFTRGAPAAAATDAVDAHAVTVQETSISTG